MLYKHSKSDQGSALLVTIMLTSIMLIAALILLERIIPYSKKIRSMQDALQSEYTTRGEVELGKLEFKKQNNRANINRDNRIQGGGPVRADVPFHTSGSLGEFVVIAQDVQIPFWIKLFQNNTSQQYFGTSGVDPSWHALSTYGGGLTFDLSGINTNSSFSLDLEATNNDKATSPTWKIAIEFVYSDENGENPFFGNIVLNAWRANILDSVDSASKKLWGNASFLAGQNCKKGQCFMKLKLTNSTQKSILIKIKSNVALPDLNAILVADGLSSNKLYHSRIVELIPVIQSI